MKFLIESKKEVKKKKVVKTVTKITRQQDRVNFPYQTIYTFLNIGDENFKTENNRVRIS